MSPQEMIERYVQDVARRLPWRMREDVESELRDLLTEQQLAGEKQEGEAEEGAERRAHDMLAQFGAPVEVAARYYTPPPVIDPLDSRRFWQVAAAFLLVVVVLRYSLPDEALGVDALTDSEVFWRALAPILGVLTLVFWAIGAVRRRAARSTFSPRRLPPVRDAEAANRLGYAAMVAFFTFGTVVLVQPGRWLELVSGGRVAPEAVAAFAYDPDFLAVRAPWVLAAMVVGILFLAWVGIQGRWNGVTRRIELGLSLLTNLILLSVMQAGPIFSAAPTDRVAKSWIALIIAATLLDSWWKWDRLRAARARFAIVNVPGQ